MSRPSATNYLQIPCVISGFLDILLPLSGLGGIKYLIKTVDIVLDRWGITQDISPWNLYRHLKTAFLPFLFLLEGFSATKFFVALTWESSRPTSRFLRPVSASQRNRKSYNKASIPCMTYNWVSGYSLAPPQPLATPENFPLSPPGLVSALLQ